MLCHSEAAKLVYNNTTFVISLYRLETIADIVNGKLHGNGDLQIVNIYTDTRSSRQHSALFIAIKTAKNNGNTYVSHAINQGTVAVLVSEKPKIDCNYILVKDTLEALQKLATYHRNQYKIPIIAITGSNGKTIVKEWVSTLLSEDYTVCKSPKSYNSQIGVPLSIWKLSEKYTIGIFEAGISEPKEMDNLREIINPTVGVFTHLGDSHSANFNTIEQKLEEKLKLFTNCETIICSANQPEVISAIKKLGKKTFTWGSNMMCDLHVVKSTSGDYILTYQSISHPVKLTNSDKATVENTFTAMATALALGIEIEPLLSRANTLPTIDMRLQQVEGIQGNTLVLDYYNSDFQSIDIAFDFLKQQNTHENVTVLLSDILESNLDTTQLYTDVNAVLLKHNVGKLIGIGKEISNAQSVFELPSTFYSDTASFLKKHALFELKDECLLLKGARVFEFEKIAERLRKRTHQTCLEINLSKMQHNLDAIKTKVGSSTMVMAMVKALAYGSGDYQIAKLLEKNKIDYLGVAYTDEATQLRASGISTPIMVLNPDLTDLTPYLENNIQPVIYSFASLDKVIGADIQIHLEFDTGMRRLGFLKEDLPLLIAQLKRKTDLKVASVFSHLAGADDTALDDFSKQQVSDFKHISSEIENQLKIKILKHLANTAAIERLPSATFDMVRMGIGLYGISTLENDATLNPVGTFKSYISQIKTVPAHAGIGYGQHSKADADRKIAIVAVGYADGYSRSFSQGKGAFFINEKKAPIVGNVCMDMTMCDVTDIVCEEGDEVIIFGEYPRVSELAEQIGTIPYEILANVSERVNRVFYQE
jgi:alanine racemase